MMKRKASSSDDGLFVKEDVSEPSSKHEVMPEDEFPRPKRQEPGIPVNNDNERHKPKPVKKAKVLNADKANLGTEGVKRPSKKRKSLNPEDQKPRIVAGIDYGTTFSGCSYAFFHGKRMTSSDISTIHQWPGVTCPNDYVEKCPSIIAYKSDGNPSLDKDSVIAFEIEPNTTVCAWTKVLLEDKKDSPALNIPLEASKAVEGLFHIPANKTPCLVVADFLDQLYGHLFEQIGKELTKETLEVTPIEIWLTHPALFTNSAKDLLRKAALRAGIGAMDGRPDDRLFMISEPEAALFSATQTSIERSDAVQFEVGSSVLIIDGGGGTTDLTTYRLKSIDPLNVEEACVGIGDWCGSTQIDRALMDLLEERFGDQFTSLPLARRGPGSHFMNDFERMKKGFDGTILTKKYRLRLVVKGMKTSPFYDEDDCEIIITGSDMKNLFDPPVQQILGLVKQQLTAAKEMKTKIKIAVLAGGFGSSPYLFSVLSTYFKANGIRFMIADRPWSAISRGAVVRGTKPGMIKSTRCRRHYGISSHRDFKEGDDEDDAFICPATGRKRVPGHMRWHVYRGEKLYKSTHRVIRAYHVIKDENDLEQSWCLYSSSLRSAPDHVDDPGVEVEGVVKVHLPRSLLAKPPKKMKRGVKSTAPSPRIVDVKIEMGLANDMGTLEFHVVVNKHRVGEATIEYARNVTHD